MGWIVILTELVTPEGLQAFDFAFAYTVCTDSDDDGYAIEGGALMILNTVSLQ